MDYFFLLGYIIIISTGWQHMRRRNAQSAERRAKKLNPKNAMRLALGAMRGGINLENASAGLRDERANYNKMKSIPYISKTPNSDST